MTESRHFLRTWKGADDLAVSASYCVSYRAPMPRRPSHAGEVADAVPKPRDPLLMLLCEILAALALFAVLCLLLFVIATG